MSDNETGSALLLTLVALLLLSLLGVFVVLTANTEVKISDNFEAQIQATYAALAGLNHARALARGISWDDLLRGPDGYYSASEPYLALARGFEFRNPVGLPAAHAMDISSPAEFTRTSDDGVISTGFYGASNGIPLIPAAGLAFVAPNPFGDGEIVTSRYFVKVTDNNGEELEVTGDPSDNPFIDGDGTVIVRSVGVSQTFSETVGTDRRRNSVSVFEARFKRMSAFDTGSALVVLGTDVRASFEGTLEISGGLFPGIGTIDTDTADTEYPDRIISAAAEGSPFITGGGQPAPSVMEISSGIRSDRDRSQLLNPAFLWDFINRKIPKSADLYLDGDQNWAAGAVPYLGAYDGSKPWNAPGQDPRITVVRGSLNVTGELSGSGLLIVTGDFSYTGTCAYYGLILVVGAGNLEAAGSGEGIRGGLLVASLIQGGAGSTFGIPSVSIGGGSRILSDREAVRMALGLVPVSQVSFREIAGSDP